MKILKTNSDLRSVENKEVEIQTDDVTSQTITPEIFEYSSFFTMFNETKVSKKGFKSQANSPSRKMEQNFNTNDKKELEGMSFNSLREITGQQIIPSR